MPSEPRYTDKYEWEGEYDAVLNALQDASYKEFVGGVDYLATRNYGQQPDGDLVGDKADGELFSTDTTLTAGETFTSDWHDTDGWSSIEVIITADEPSAVEGVKLQFTEDAQNPSVDVEKERSFDEADVLVGYRVFHTASILDGFRLVYENGANPTDIQITTTVKTDVSLDGANYVVNNTLGHAELRVGTDINGQGVKIGGPSSLFGDVASIQRNTLIDISSSFGTSAITDEVTSTGSGALTQDPDPDTGELVLTTGATADSSICLRTTEYGRYTPGFSAQQGCGIRIPTPPTTDGEARWGYFDDNNGFYWGYDGSQEELFVARRRNGTEVERVYKTDWNRAVIGDIFDREVDVADGAIFQIDFSWYGYGIIQFAIVSQSADNQLTSNPRQDTVVVHAMSVVGSTSIADPNQPITVEADNGAGGEDFDVRVGGRQFSIYGDPPKGSRVTSESRVGATIGADTWTHLMTWRRNPDAGIANARLNMSGMDFATDQTARMALVIDGNLSGLSYGQPELIPANETLLEVSTAGSFDGLDGGTKIWEGSIRVSGTGQAQSQIDAEVDLNLGQTNTVSLIAQGVGGTGNVLTTMRLTEDW